MQFCASLLDAGWNASSPTQSTSLGKLQLYHHQTLDLMDGEGRAYFGEATHASRNASLQTNLSLADSVTVQGASFS